MISLNTLADVNVKAKRVLLRVDFNAPLDDDGKITDLTRLEASLPTVKHLLKQGGRVILMSHLGRPDPDEIDPHLRLDEVAKAFAKLLKKPVKKLDACIGPKVQKAVMAMKNGEVLMLENTRFYKGEKKSEPGFTKELASLGEIFVNDAFGAAHRADASTSGLAQHLPAYAGLLLEAEIAALSPLLHSPKRPMVLIVGGAKIDTKIGVLKNFMEKTDTFLIGGGLANTFLYSEGYDVGQSLCEKDKRDVAQEIILEAEKHHERFMLPSDVIVADEIRKDAKTLDIPIEDVESSLRILDIGSQTIQRFVKVIEKAATIVWNGPPGLYEMKPFARGTRAIADAVARAKGTTILGGGDTIDAIKKFGHTFDEFDHVSTGGGAMLEFLEGKVLPGIEAVRKR